MKQCENGYKMRVLHLIHDDKFFDSTIRLFKHLGVNSKFVLLCGDIGPLKYIKNSEEVYQVQINSPEYEALLEEINDYNLVWVHYLDKVKAKFINKIPSGSSVKVFWSTWGGDYVDLLGYSRLRFRSRLHWFNSLTSRWKSRYLRKKVLSKFGINVSFGVREELEALTRVNFFSTVLASEERLLRKGLGPDTKYCFYAYVTFPPIVSTYPKCDINSKNMWLGNSGTYPNHHLDLLPILTRIPDWQIIAPLSYGTPDLIKFVDEKAKQLLNDRWNPILDFMPYDMFVNTMSKCSVFVFDMFRQQALGNIICALKMGGCVFLNKESPTYQEFMKSDIKVYSTDDLKSRLHNCLKEFVLCREDNIKRINEIYDFTVIEKKLRETMDFLESQVVNGI